MVTLVYLITGILISAFWIAFGVSSIAEHKPRAAWLSTLLLVVCAAFWIGWFQFFAGQQVVLILPVLAVVTFALLFFAPLGRKKPLLATPTGERFDERSMMFAREDYQPGSETFEQYYKMHPEHRKLDDSIRKRPELLGPGGRFYEPVLAQYIKSTFQTNREMLNLVDGPVAEEQLAVDPAEITARVKAYTRGLGADEVGIGPLNQAWVYSHVGRGPEPWGAEINLDHKYVIAFTIEMDYDHVEAAPKLDITEETANGYLKGATISVALARFIREMGYPARAHISGSNYQVMLPPVAYDAGLGELGRFGYLISNDYGARVRLGAVTTDLPLAPDTPVHFGVQEFCEICKKCATNCPSKSIPTGEKTTVRGVEKWQLEMETCMRYWRVVGSDCGICMKVCPFSHPNTFVHKLIRAGIKRSAFARRVSLWGDDLFYGKKVEY